jgi:anhydro-N-acetylmuramic acid kinase
MSGTSLDGIDAALVELTGPDQVTLRHFHCRPYAASERAVLLDGMARATARDLAMLNVSLGAWLADAADAVLAEARVPKGDVAFVASHGQTLWHTPGRATLQLGDPAVIAERLGVTVVSDFRSRDVAAGGQGAPLVPVADALCFGASDHPRILLNLGGMANVTWVRRRADLDAVVAGDTGPGMAIIDGVARLVNPSLSFDDDGALADQGKVDEAVLAELLQAPFFAAPPPRSTGREFFGQPYAAELHRRLPGPDGVRTAVALTVESVVRFCEAHLPEAPEVVAAGGGTQHPVLMSTLATRLAVRGMALKRFDELFFPSQAKEAAAFALLGWLTLHGQPGNVPGATGAAGPRVLGSITPP